VNVLGSIIELQACLQEDFDAILKAKRIVREKLLKYSDGKVLKGDEFVGWLGEIYGKILLGGSLVDDSFEWDFITADEKRVSVKTRKGWNSGWRTTSAIPKVEGEDCPSHLMFVHLDDDYTVERIWLYPWKDLLRSNRFAKHMVRGNLRSYKFRVMEGDRRYIVYAKDR